MDARASLLAGAKAAAMGALVGTGLPTLVAIAAATGTIGDDPGRALMVIVMPFGTGLLAAGTGLAVFGWPLTAWLHRTGRETRRAYVVPGVILGTLSVATVSHAFFGEFPAMSALLGVFGALTGGATAHFWWKFARRQRAMVHAPSLDAIFE
ncbi:MAG: hypothetical protein RIC51_04620 [Erythrobacter sp.]|uniref:hypothetical protein n=1 Tax=Erythrobacter sp. TaxID=1042 RepID=UPI0032EF062C